MSFSSLGEVDEELICPICSSVLEEPLQVVSCEHAFCESCQSVTICRCRHCRFLTGTSCITEWLSRQPTCPVDRQAITTTNLRSVPRILRNLLSRLNITCDNQIYGCTQILKLDALHAHLEECEHNPKRPLPCENGCGFIIPKDEFKDHNCVRELRTLCHSQQQKLAELKTEINDQNLTINELKRELNLIKEFMRAMRVSNPAMRAIADQMERDEVLRWSNSLPRARVTRWGGMISTPDDSLQVRQRNFR